MDSLSIRKIENGFLVIQVFNGKNDYKEVEVFCKNVAQVVKLVKAQYKQPMQVPF